MYKFKNKKFNEAIMKVTDNISSIELIQDNIKISEIINGYMLPTVKLFWIHLKYSINPPKDDQDHYCLQLSYKSKVLFVETQLNINDLTKKQLDDYFIKIEEFILKTDSDVSLIVNKFNDE